MALLTMALLTMALLGVPAQELLETRAQLQTLRERRATAATVLR
jgi:hypothetical protein